MKKWLLPALALTLVLGMGNAADSQAMTAEEKIQKESQYAAAYLASQEKDMSLMEQTVIPPSGNLACENGGTLDFTFADGVLTISGNGDKLTTENSSYFSFNDSITEVVFTADCTLTSLDFMFRYCRNISSVQNIPATVTSIDSAFSNTALTAIPSLPEGLLSMSYAFSSCDGITNVDFSALPKTVTDLSGAFNGTSITEANMVVPSNTIAQMIQYAYCLANCEKLEKIVFDASNLNDEASLWLQGIAADCPSLVSFELKNIPATNKNPGSVCSGYMFENCVNLTSVKNEGYFYFSADHLFSECSKLSVLETKGITGLYGDDSLKKAFYNCSSLSGNVYIGFSEASKIYSNINNFAELGDKLTLSFAGCNAQTNFYIGCQQLVDYWNQLKTTTGSKSDANFYYWTEGDSSPQTPTPTATPTPTVSPSPAPVVETPKTISTLKLTKYKKGSKKITGKTLKKATVKVVVNKKTYTAKANAKGAFTVKLKSKLKKNAKIKVTVSRSGYKAKTKTFKVK